MQRPNDEVKKLIKKAQDAIHANRLEEAVRVARLAVGADANNADAHALLGFALYAQGEPSCLESLDRAIQLSSKNLTARFARAGWYRMQKNLERFKSDVEYVIEYGQAANEYSFQRELAEMAFVWLGHDAYDGDNFPLAYDYYQSARDINPGNRSAMLGMARAVLYDSENPASAVDWLKATAVHFSGDPQALRDYGIALLKEGLINKAKNCFEELGWFINNDELKILNAITLAHEGKPEEAFNSVQRLCASVQRYEDKVLLAELALVAKKPDVVLQLLAKQQHLNTYGKLLNACAYLQKNEIKACREQLDALWQENVSFINKMYLITVEGRLVSSQEERAALRQKFITAMRGRVFMKNPKWVSVALAAFACGDTETAKIYLAPFLKEYYPQAIPLKFQDDFLKLISGLPALTKADLALLKVHDRRVFKNQLLMMMRANLTGKPMLNVCLRALCRDSLIGSIFHLQRNNFGVRPKPSILKGALKTITKALNILVVNEDILGIEPETIRLLREEIKVSGSFAKNLEEEYPNLYAWIKKLSVDMFPPKNQQLRVTDFIPKQKEREQDYEKDELYKL